MKHYNKIFIWITFFILVILFSSVFFFFKQTREARLETLGDHIISNFRAGLAYEMTDLLSLSLALAEDAAIKNALLNDNESQGYEILRNITRRFKKYTHLQSLRIQLLTPDFYIFARSWNEGFEGMPIWWFRDDLQELKHNKQPKVGMEIGRLLTFKATIPVRSGKKLIGYLEAIKLIDEFSVKLRRKGIELFALMDERFLEQAALMRNFPVIHNHILANQNYYQQGKEKLQAIDWNKLEKKTYMLHEGTYYLLEPMHNGKGDKIGVYVLALSQKALKNYENEKQGFSFFTQFSDEDMQNVVASWAHPFGSFRNGYDKELIELLPRLKKEDKQEFESEAKSILGEYNKEELIDIILSNKHNEKKTGVIK
ncbi:hypothetical protein YH65_08745 [Sulfurovum lithotrophicum]|uniref:Double Cache domain-containing protein n=1 Tax=Sulfurovum lithotrophicum TaxID=206403 RepID=A0A7U4RR61_9BACT|nr:cache domain-containing protein [Sulfurovum lithotrophicum]AKF25451.1 hypothetical protein YH65_08745 [Sulfurovum lithotrophicum]